MKRGDLYVWLLRDVAGEKVVGRWIKYQLLLTKQTTNERTNG
jgi:hypothetical protein